MNKIQAAEQFRRAMQMFAESLPMEKAMEIATVYEEWEPGRDYKGGKYLIYGTNGVGDPQLYCVNDGKEHTSQADWTPDITPSLYTPIGLDSAGYPMWSAPTGAHDAYDIGDVVNYNGYLYESTINGNTIVPGTDERYWIRRDDL